MARRNKALLQNADFGENRQAHREHRSKKGRKKLFKASNGAFYLYKMKKEAQENDFDDYPLPFCKRKGKIKS